MRVQQILINLVGNAVKFTEAGEIAVCVRCPAQSATQVTLQFCVRDTGIGIPREQIKPIFEAFAQAHSSTNRLYGGTGLGLTISERLAALMNSRIEVASVEDGGSEIGFTVTLQRADEARHTVDRLPGLRVLVVDDQAQARDALCRAGAAFGCADERRRWRRRRPRRIAPERRRGPRLRPVAGRLENARNRRHRNAQAGPSRRPRSDCRWWC